MDRVISTNLDYFFELIAQRPAQKFCFPSHTLTLEEAKCRSEGPRLLLTTACPDAAGLLLPLLKSLSCHPLGIIHRAFASQGWLVLSTAAPAQSGAMLWYQIYNDHRRRFDVLLPAGLR